MEEQSQIWQEKSRPEQPVLRGRRRADAVIVGGGLTGLTIALWLSLAGLRVSVVEAERLGSGSSACCAGVVSMDRQTRFAHLQKSCSPETVQAHAAVQRQALLALRDKLAAAAEWQDGPVQLVAENPRQLALLQAEEQALRRADIPAEMTRSTQCPLPADGALTLPGMATLNPSAYLSWLQAQAQKQGVRFYEHSRVTGLETDLVITSRGSVLAPYIVIATGYPIVNIPGWYFLRMTQRRSRLTLLTGGAAFDGVFLSAGGGWTLRRRGNHLLLEEQDGAENALAQLTDPACGWHILHQQRGLLVCTPDGLPYIGPYSAKTPNLFVATGFGDNGILMSVAAAQAISARILGLPTEGFAVYSGQRKRGAAQAAVHLAGRYLGGWLTRWHAPLCPHLGCKLVYDRQARLWECPCHGSRFDDIGRVLNAPAVHAASLNRKKR